MTKDEILDYIITFEDEELKRVREEVIKRAEYNFGKDGREVAEKYYRQLDGEEEFDEIETDDCDECKEKAKRLLEKTDFIKNISDIIFSEKLDQLVKNLNINKFTSNINKMIDDIENESCFKIDSETKNKLYCKILIKICQNNWRSDDKSSKQTT